MALHGAGWRCISLLLAAQRRCRLHSRRMTHTHPHTHTQRQEVLCVTPASHRVDGPWALTVAVKDTQRSPPSPLRVSIHGAATDTTRVWCERSKPFQTFPATTTAVSAQEGSIHVEVVPPASSGQSTGES